MFVLIFRLILTLLLQVLCSIHTLATSTLALHTDHENLKNAHKKIGSLLVFSWFRIDVIFDLVPFLWAFECVASLIKELESFQVDLNETLGTPKHCSGP